MATPEEIEGRRRSVAKWLRSLARRTSAADARALIYRVSRVRGLSKLPFLQMNHVIQAARRRIAAIDRQRARKAQADRAIQVRVKRAVMPLACKIVQQSENVARQSKELERRTAELEAKAVADVERAVAGVEQARDAAEALQRRQERFVAQSYRQMEDEQAQGQRDLDDAHAEISTWAREQRRAGQMDASAVVKEQNARNFLAGERYYDERFAAEERHDQRVVANAINLFGTDQEWLAEQKCEAASKRKRHDEKARRRYSERKHLLEN
jgi:hypothetical protein